jgi:hypothetical protein
MTRRRRRLAEIPSNKGLLTDAWVRYAPPRTAEAPVVRRAEKPKSSRSDVPMSERTSQCYEPLLQQSELHEVHRAAVQAALQRDILLPQLTRLFATASPSPPPARPRPRRPSGHARCYRILDDGSRAIMSQETRR